MRTSSQSRSRVSSTVEAALRELRDQASYSRMKGHVGFVLVGEDGRVRQQGLVENLITDVGDEYYAKMGAAGVAPAAPAAPVLAKGMKLGTGTTAPAKNGAGGALVTYQAGSQLAFDATFPAVSNLGAGLGWQIRYKSTWAAGVATANGLAEVVIVNPSSLTDATSAASETISRALLSPTVNKGASDTLAVTWDHKMLGA